MVIHKLGKQFERIDQIVEAHGLDKSEADAATKVARDVINIMLERHLSAGTAYGLELLAHLRNDRCR